METTTISNASFVAFESIGKIYVFCYEQLRHVNVPVPPPEYVQQMFFNMVGTAYNYAPPALQQFFSTLAQLPIQANIVPVLLALAVLYVAYSVVAALVRSVVRVVIGFIRFSLIVAAFASVLILLQQYYDIPFLQNVNEYVQQHQHQDYQQQQQQFTYHA
ncbi:hypothetical protein BDB00DRAFT_836285 [Zychaea mexicana]|uniref:uncharacterized protein n=1 Tax=Zychaea mexicana TaxID=64656 RepID=UPI0022FEC570|nr:uncharacterized protein BDB00DRAFT_836285 [Zychaea mexicana]KAI9490837.1 hypothetical protein BDB00DRAFT_836285 [Zychaea mexicana]